MHSDQAKHPYEPKRDHNQQQHNVELQPEQEANNLGLQLVMQKQDSLSSATAVQDLNVSLTPTAQTRNKHQQQQQLQEAEYWQNNQHNSPKPQVRIVTIQPALNANPRQIIQIPRLALQKINIHDPGSNPANSNSKDQPKPQQLINSNPSKPQVSQTIVMSNQQSKNIKVSQRSKRGDASSRIGQNQIQNLNYCKKVNQNENNQPEALSSFSSKTDNAQKESQILENKSSDPAIQINITQQEQCSIPQPAVQLKSQSYVEQSKDNFNTNEDEVNKNSFRQTQQQKQPEDNPQKAILDLIKSQCLGSVDISDDQVLNLLLLKIKLGENAQMENEHLRGLLNAEQKQTATKSTEINEPPSARSNLKPQPSDQYSTQVQNKKQQDKVQQQRSIFNSETKQSNKSVFETKELAQNINNCNKTNGKDGGGQSKQQIQTKMTTARNKPVVVGEQPSVSVGQNCSIKPSGSKKQQQQSGLTGSVVINGPLTRRETNSSVLGLSSKPLQQTTTLVKAQSGKNDTYPGSKLSTQDQHKSSANPPPTLSLTQITQAGSSNAQKSKKVAVTSRQALTSAKSIDLVAEKDPNQVIITKQTTAEPKEAIVKKIVGLNSTQQKEQPEPQPPCLGVISGETNRTCPSVKNTINASQDNNNDQSGVTQKLGEYLSQLRDRNSSLQERLNQSFKGSKLDSRPFTQMKVVTAMRTDRERPSSHGLLINGQFMTQQLWNNNQNNQGKDQDAATSGSFNMQDNTNGDSRQNFIADQQTHSSKQHQANHSSNSHQKRDHLSSLQKYNQATAAFKELNTLGSNHSIPGRQTSASALGARQSKTGRSHYNSQQLCMNNVGINKQYGGSNAQRSQRNSHQHSSSQYLTQQSQLQAFLQSHSHQNGNLNATGTAVAHTNTNVQKGNSSGQNNNQSLIGALTNEQVAAGLVNENSFKLAKQQSQGLPQQNKQGNNMQVQNWQVEQKQQQRSGSYIRNHQSKINNWFDSAI